MPAIGTFRHVVTLDAPGDPVPDPDGGYTEAYAPLTPPTWDCAIEQASTRSLESLGAGSVIAQATHLVRGPYHAGITTQTRITFQGRILNVLYVANRDERGIETDLVCAEVVK
jgi:SPP1 family predicted phage head-tail adaptor